MRWCFSVKKSSWERIGTTTEIVEGSSRIDPSTARSASAFCGSPFSLTASSSINYRFLRMLSAAKPLVNRLRRNPQLIHTRRVMSALAKKFFFAVRPQDYDYPSRGRTTDVRVIVSRRGYQTKERSAERIREIAVGQPTRPSTRLDTAARSSRRLTSEAEHARTRTLP